MREHYYEMSKEDLLNEEIQILTNDGLKEKIKKNRNNMCFQMGLFTTILYAILIIILKIYSHSVHLYVILSYIITLIIIEYIFYSVYSKILFRSVKKEVYEKISQLQKRKIIIMNDSIKIEQNNNSFCIDKNNLSLYEDSKYIKIVINELQVYLIPKNSFKDINEQNQFKEDLKNNIGKIIELL